MRILKMSIGGVEYKVLGYVSGSAYDKQSGWGFYVCQTKEGGEDEEFTLVPMDAGLSPFDCAKFHVDVEVKVVEVEKP